MRRNFLPKNVQEKMLYHNTNITTVVINSGYYVV